MILLTLIAFISGVLTVFSPCVLPILPIVLASGIDGNSNRIKGVITGLIASFTVASLLLATLVSVLGVPVDTVRLFAVLLLIVFGVSLVIPAIWEKIQYFLETHLRLSTLSGQRSKGFLGGLVTGISLGIIWTPCIGPILATVATLAALNSISIKTAIIAFAYAVGTGIPLYFIAKGGAKVGNKLGFVKQNNTMIRQVFGIIILLTALMIYSGLDRSLQEWTIDNLPESWVNITDTFESRVNIDSSLLNLGR